MSEPVFTIDPDLEARLVQLGRVLDVPTGEGLLDAVTNRLGGLDAGPEPEGVRPPPWQRRTLVAAAAALVVLIGLLAVEPSRSAIARWLGIGAVQLTPVNELPARRATPVPATDPDGDATTALAAARTAVGFRILVPDPVTAGALRSVELDASVPGGLVALGYDRFVVVEVASLSDQAPVLAKLLPPGTEVQWVTVVGRSGVWITGAPHALAHLAPDGTLVESTLRQAGDVLVWEDGGVTFRIEGAATLEEAMAVAGSLR